MKQSYGELILPKDSILYCASINTNNIIHNNCNLSILHNIFFHPCEYQIGHRLYKITLKKDISLFCDFNIELYRNNKFIIRSFFKKIIKDYEIYKIILSKLKKYNYNGYIQPQYGKYEKSEIFLFDDKDFFEIENEEYVQSWKNENIIKYYGNYPICFMKYKAFLILNKKYEEQINLYLEFMKDEIIKINKNNNLFYLLFINSDIKYNDIEQISIENF